MILGLDISTSVIGVCVLDSKNEILLQEAWDLKNKNKYKDLFDKSLFVSDALSKLKEKYSIQHIFIEQSLHSFRSGFSSAQVLSILSRFNGIVSWLCFKIFSIKPEYIAATSARKLCGIKIPKGTKAKEVVIQHLLSQEKKFNIEINKNGNIKPNYYDIADAIVIAKAGSLIAQKFD